jgi:hypothetical protein
MSPYGYDVIFVATMGESSVGREAIKTLSLTKIVIAINIFASEN